MQLQLPRGQLSGRTASRVTRQAVSLALVPAGRETHWFPNSSFPAEAGDKASPVCAQAVPVAQVLTQGITVHRGGHEVPSCDTCAWCALEPSWLQTRGEEQLLARHTTPPSGTATASPPSPLLAWQLPSERGHAVWPPGERILLTASKSLNRT